MNSRMNRWSNRLRKGSAALETGLIFIPMTLTIFGTAELGRGMWMYHTLTTAIKTATRSATFHGSDCVAATATCPATAASVAATIQSSGIGLDAQQLQLTLIADGVSYACGSLAVCVSDSTVWPPAGHNSPGLSISVSAVYSFRSVLSSFWPGQGSASVNYLAEATDVIQF
jgi:Flp pilus assembly protein TadG